jgi:hypothetical protein
MRKKARGRSAARGTAGKVRAPESIADRVASGDHSLRSEELSSR